MSSGASIGTVRQWWLASEEAIAIIINERRVIAVVRHAVFLRDRSLIR
jgi:hypothetical protein